jgi:hypothetical protein
MEIQVKVFNVLDTQRFVSKKDGSEIVKNTFVGETAGQYSKKIAFTVMGADKFNQMGIVVGGTYTVSFDVESREWQGKWFTEASAWKAVRIDGAQGQQQAPQANTSQAQETTSGAQGDGGEKKDDLPF